MKAKEYVERCKAEGMTDESIIKVCRDMFLEAQEIFEMRNVQTNEGALAVFKELDQKWKAFARNFDFVRKDGFRNYIEAISPDLYRMIRAHEIMMNSRISQRK